MEQEEKLTHYFQIRIGITMWFKLVTMPRKTKRDLIDRMRKMIDETQSDARPKET